MSDLSFTPEDFDSVLTIEDLTAHIEKIVIEIRTNSILPNLMKDIDKMNEIAKEGLDTKSSIQVLLKAYKYIQSASMKMRQELSKYITLETYDSIAYAFYYDGQRFSAENLNADWLFVTNKGELRLSLDKAAKDLQEGIEGTAKEKISDIFNRHYKSYLNAITGMYNGQIGRGRLNKGHIAEAYEIHISEHHSQAYQLLNAIDSPQSVMDKMIYAFELETKGDEYWSSHESPNAAWKHIRSSMGTQRGTVAGDVGRFQVKQGSSSSKNIYSSQVRIASLSTLKNGILMQKKVLL